MKKKLSRNKIVHVYNALSKIKSETKDFVFFVNRNIKHIQDEIDAVGEAAKFSDPKYQEYQNKRVELLSQYGKKDSNGNLIQITEPNGLSKVTLEDDKLKIFNEKHDKLVEEYKESIKEYEKQTKNFEMYMNEEVEFEYTPIPYVVIPDKLTESGEFDALSYLVKETDDEIAEIISKKYA